MKTRRPAVFPSRVLGVNRFAVGPARCGGRAVLTLDEKTWRACLTCEGTGGVWNRPSDEVDAVWRQIVARWPGAALSWVAR
jgi:hypothetical protein